MGIASFYLPLFCLTCSWVAPASAATPAASGQIGSRSQTSVRITASVAPRAQVHVQRPQGISDAGRLGTAVHELCVTANTSHSYSVTAVVLSGAATSFGEPQEASHGTGLARGLSRTADGMAAIPLCEAGSAIAARPLRGFPENDPIKAGPGSHGGTLLVIVAPQ